MRLARLAPLLMMVSGCGPGSNAPPDGGPPLALDVVGAAQIGLHYGKSTQLSVRYHADDASAAPVAGATVHFSIFRDPAGSTLTRDVATTDSLGVATVTLTAGQAEADFRVAATAINAPEADFDVVVSKLDFVEIDAELAWAGAATLRALLYDDKTCAALPPSPTLPPPSRALSKAADKATLQFVNLLSKPYALVGRAESASGTLVAYGCVDIGAELVPPGSVSVVPLPLSAAVPSPVGSYTLTSTLVPAPSAYAALVGKWQQFGGGCPYGAAQGLLDAMGVASHRDAPQADGCRPTSTTSLDEQLQALLTAPPMAPANELGAIAADLAAITASATVKSKLTVTAASAATYTAEHALASAELAVSASVSKTYDLVALGEPVIDVKGVAFADDGMTVTIGAHGFTLGWTTLWLQAFTDLSLTARIAGLGSPAIPALVAAVVAPAAHGGKMGCAAVDDLVCSVTTGSGTCALTTPCASALGPLASSLAAGFAPASGIDLSLSGTATPVDANGDLIVDLLTGSWSGPALSSTSSFTGTQP
ncbi:MAG TPA: Ig-like domain-containing protein [Polyangia bacterium]